MSKKICIITGASAGLGVEFTKQAKFYFNYDEIWLVARRIEPMQSLAKLIGEEKVKCFSVDLSQNKALAEFIDNLEKEKPKILLLINNAGFGKIGKFSELDIEQQLKMIDVNVGALVHLTHACLKFMDLDSKIIQVASSIAYTPSPGFAIYAATKSFVLSFSRALRYELLDKGIRVLAVCPGPVKTEFFDVAKNKDGDVPFNQFLMKEPDEVVRLAYEDLFKNKEVSICNSLLQILIKVMHFVPKQWLFPLLSKRI